MALHNRMRIGVAGPDILLGGGGAQVHALNVMRILSSRYGYEFIYFPNPGLYGKYRINKEIVMKNIERLKDFGVRVIDLFPEILSNRGLKYDDVVDLYAKYCRDHSIDLLYAFDFMNEEIYPRHFILNLSRKTGIKFSVTLQSDFDVRFRRYLYYLIKLWGQGFMYAPFFVVYRFLDNKIMLNKLRFNSKHLAFVVVLNSFYQRFLRGLSNIFIFDPGNGILNYEEHEYAYNINSIKKHTISKENDKIIFFARLNYSKGIFDLIRVLRHVVKIYGKVKLIMIGKFVRDYERELFFRQLRRWDLDKFVEYRGFLPDDELYRELATAKVMVYPSHSDLFPIAVAQSLFFGTPVVTYDMPGLWAYRGLPAVRFVKEFDYEGMAREVVNILRMDDISPLFTDEVISFLKRHTWDEVAKQYHEVFMRYVSHEL